MALSLWQFWIIDLFQNFLAAFLKVRFKHNEIYLLCQIFSYHVLWYGQKLTSQYNPNFKNRQTRSKRQNQYLI